MTVGVFMKEAVAEVFDNDFDDRVGYNNLFGGYLANTIDWDEIYENQPMARIPDAYREAIEDILDHRGAMDAFNLQGAVNNPYGGAYYDVEAWAQDFPRLEQYENHLNGLIACDWSEEEAVPLAVQMTLEGEIYAALQEMLNDWGSIREALINEMLATV